jgi:lipase chaperone LimK
MQSQSRKYSSKGSVSVDSFQNRLRLRLPRQLFDGKLKYLTLGLDDTPGNRQIAEAKAKEIERDIQANQLVPGTFDFTQNKYRPESFRLVDPNESTNEEKNLSEIWDRYIAYKNSISSPSTIKSQNSVHTKYVEKLPTHDLSKAIETCIGTWIRCQRCS